MLGRNRKEDEKEERRFHARRIHVDVEAKRRVLEEDVRSAVNLHEFGMWGEVSRRQKRMNDKALKAQRSDGIVQSVFQVSPDTEIAVCTCLRSLTTTVSLRGWAREVEFMDLF